MRTTFKAVIVGVSPLLVLSSPARAGDSAQGVMVALNNLSNLAVVKTKTYQFDPAAGASGYFQTLVALATTGGTSGLGYDCSATRFIDCDFVNKPDAPPPPPEDATVAQNLAASVKCVFLDGGPLTATTSYRQAAGPVTGRNTRGSFTFYYDYTVSPLVSSVAPLTAWTLISSTGSSTTAAVSVQPKIAVESAKAASGGKKLYSFELKDSGGKSRIVNLAVRLNNSLVAQPNSTIVANCPGCVAGAPGAVDFHYTTNAGASGDMSLLANGDARTLLNTDADKKNDNGGKSGSELAWAAVDAVPLQLPVGAYTLEVSGKVQGIDSSFAQDFQVDEQISVVGEGCSAPQ